MVLSKRCRLFSLLLLVVFFAHLCLGHSAYANRGRRGVRVDIFDQNHCGNTVTAEKLQKGSHLTFTENNYKMRLTDGKPWDPATAHNAPSASKWKKTLNCPTTREYLIAEAEKAWNRGMRGPWLEAMVQNKASLHAGNAVGAVARLLSRMAGLAAIPLLLFDDSFTYSCAASTFDDVERIRALAAQQASASLVLKAQYAEMECGLRYLENVICPRVRVPTCLTLLRNRKQSLKELQDFINYLIDLAKKNRWPCGSARCEIDEWLEAAFHPDEFCDENGKDHESDKYFRGSFGEASYNRSFILPPAQATCPVEPDVIVEWDLEGDLCPCGLAAPSTSPSPAVTPAEVR